jgi:hypothetical protein
MALELKGAAPLREEVPPIVKRLAEEVKMSPIAWHIADDCITIVFAEGPKLHFDRPGNFSKPSTKKHLSALPVIENPILPNAAIPEFTGKGELKLPTRRGRPKK